LQCYVIVIGRRECLAKALEQYKSQLLSLYLLVHTHRREPVAWRDRWRFDGQPRRRNEIPQAANVTRLYPAQLRRHDHARRNGLAVQPFAVSLATLDGVSKRVAEIENRAPPGLSLVLGDDSGLDLAGPAYGVRKRVRVPLEQRVDVVLEPVEESRVTNRAVLDDLGEPGP